MDLVETHKAKTIVTEEYLLDTDFSYEELYLIADRPLKVKDRYLRKPKMLEKGPTYGEIKEASNLQNT